MEHTLKVAVVGSGTMGNGIAQAFAMQGHSVALADISKDGLDRALSTVKKSLERFVAKEKMTAKEAEAIGDRIHPICNDLGAAVADVDIAIEAVFEREDVKKEVFSVLGEQAPSEALLATNTSSISVTSIASAASGPERVIGMHFMNPVPLMKLVELVRGERTSDATVERAREIAEGIGKTVGVAEDYAGFVSNRILMPMLNEAAFALHEGVATREDIDTIMKLGMNHPMGPLTLSDFIGLDVIVDILDYLLKQTGDPKFRACPMLRRMVQAGKLGRKSGEGFYDYSE
ncbi:MAG TPA: 3-hydroxybutyryl-CoA dehydrogenase [Planctomycetes bacterium]|nr:3-hydroxybutyryl-CoA dehydrogenase [Planctomycetota bacterium]